MKKWWCCLLWLVLAGCENHVGTLTLPAAADYMRSPDTMYRGLDYLGTADGYHYFEKKREMAADVRFRVPESQYAPAQTFAYRSWFPRQEDVSAEWANMVLTIHREAPYRCSLGAKYYRSPSEVPVHMWRAVRVVVLPGKTEADCSAARAALAPYLRGNQQVFYYNPPSSMPSFLLQPQQRAGAGTLNTAALDDMMSR